MRRNTLPAVERALAGRTLAVLGDPRPEVMTLDGMHFCYVPFGPFVMGSRDDESQFEKPQHTLDLTYPFFIARFPVTVAQWREYRQCSGTVAEDQDSLRGRANDPVGDVSWHEALRFCDFLTQAWRGLLPAGWTVTLPSEAEWEKAARGGERYPAEYNWLTPSRLGELVESPAACEQMPNSFPARDYPWGNGFDAGKANVESAVGETSAVGCYPTAFSPYGCEEMSGNVWEWTRSLWGKDWAKPDFAYPYDPHDPIREALDADHEVWRVVRGGSFNYLRDSARCASRFRTLPGYRNHYFGFRVVLRSAPVPQL